MQCESPSIEVEHGKRRSPGAEFDDDFFAKSPRASPLHVGTDPPPLSLPPALKRQAPVPCAPPSMDKQNIIGSSTAISSDEEYSSDEKMLNDFLFLHPMLRSARGAPRGTRAARISVPPCFAAWKPRPHALCSL